MQEATQKKLKRLAEKWANQKAILEQEEQIRRERHQIVAEKKKRTTTKRYMLYLFGTCTLIELFTGYLMIHQMVLAQKGLIVPDMSPQITLISVVVAEVVAFAIYAVKSLKENTVGGVVYDMAMRNIEEEPTE